MLAQQSGSLGICHFTHACLPKTRLATYLQEKTINKRVQLCWVSQWEKSREAKIKVARKHLSSKCHIHPMVKCVGVNFLAGFHRLPSSFMSALCRLQIRSGWARGVPSLRLESVTLAITALRRGEDGSFLERLICFYFASAFHVPSSSVMQRKQLLLAWP